MANIYDMTDTWNDAGTTFDAIKINVIDLNSAADSLLLNLQVNGSTKFSVQKAGDKINFTDPNYGAAYIKAQVARIEFSPGASGGLAQGSIDFAGRFCVTNTLQIGSVDQANAKVVLARDADDALALRRSTNAQAFNIYNTYTDNSNYERGFMKWNSNVLEIGTEAAGTGTARNVVLNGANRVSKISDVSSGTDAAYETAINAIIDALEAHGLAATT